MRSCLPIRIWPCSASLCSQCAHLKALSVLCYYVAVAVEACGWDAKLVLLATFGETGEACSSHVVSTVIPRSRAPAAPI